MKQENPGASQPESGTHRAAVAEAPSAAPTRFAPGASPFRAKGVLFLGYIRYCEESVPGGFAAVRERMHEPLVQAFYAQPFIVGGLYDALPIVPLARAAALVAGIPHLEFLRGHAQWQAHRDIHGVYRLMLKLATPRQVIQALPGTAKRYFDFVRSEIRQLAPGRWEVTIHGVPAPVLLVYKAATEAFIRRALELAGAKGLRHRWVLEEPAGDVAGVPVLRLQRELSWEAS